MTTTKRERASEYFRAGFNCAQSVLAAFCGGCEIAEETALLLASGLGGGLRAGEVCGAACGAVLAIGLRKGRSRADDLEAKQDCDARTVEFMAAFRAANGALTCRDILGCDTSTPEGREYAQAHALIKAKCVDVVGSAISILEELGY